TFVTVTAPPGSSCATDPGIMECHLNGLDSAHTLRVDLVVQTTTAGTITNVVTVSAPENDSNLSNNMSAEATVVVHVPRADLSVTKSHAPDPPVVGHPLTYTVAVTNHGPDTATAIVITDTLPSGVTFVSASE